MRRRSSEPGKSQEGSQIRSVLDSPGSEVQAQSRARLGAWPVVPRQVPQSWKNCRKNKASDADTHGCRLRHRNQTALDLPCLMLLGDDISEE